MDWSSQQNDALRGVGRWLKAGSPQVFRLFGYAGTGKTTLARHIADTANETVVFAAFTGKAASVMRAKGCADARTIHSLIYRPTEIDEETESPSFVLNDDSPVAGAGLVIVDECSMVDEEIGRDLLSFGRPILVLGDPAQLPPIKGGGYFTDAEPDVMLTEVHRTAADDPIVRLSMAIRGGERPPPGSFGRSRVIRRQELTTEMVTGADQILVGLNRTRRRYNARLRELLDRRGDLPLVGDKLVCLRNDRKKGLMNGSLWSVRTASGMRRGKLSLTVVPEDAPERKPTRIKVAPQFFLNEEAPPYLLRKDSDEFDYGYALTVHKAQGSQWNEVVVFDESYAFREHRLRWLYTAVTRAAEKLTLVV